MATTTAITATAEMDGISEPSKGYGSADYTVTLAVGEHEVTVPAWAHCGWLAPGAHADLDGSGLAVWGDSQPGGWSVCDGDGAYSGRVRVIDDRDPEPADPITVGADHLGSVEIEPEIVPEWAAALAAVAAAPEDSDERSEREDEASDVREEIVEAIKAALDRVLIDVDPPTAEEVWDALGSRAEVDGAPRVRVGRWLGCPLVAWRTETGCCYDSWPDGAPNGAVKAARQAAAEAAEQSVEDAVAAVTAEDSE